jgi:hypothetical protein
MDLNQNFTELRGLTINLATSSYFSSNFDLLKGRQNAKKYMICAHIHVEKSINLSQQPK